jgi:hypothetical protein
MFMTLAEVRSTAELGLSLAEWIAADQAGERCFPHEFMYRILRSGKLEYQIDPVNSWLLAAAEKNLPMFVPGWEDSTLGNMYVGHCISGGVKNVHTVRTGIEYMMALADWYLASQNRSAMSGPSAFSKLPVASREISRFASCRCCIRICSVRTCHFGDISARPAIQPRVTVVIPGPFPMRKSHGASWASIPRNSLSKATLPLSLHSCLP